MNAPSSTTNSTPSTTPTMTIVLGVGRSRFGAPFAVTSVASVETLCAKEEESGSERMGVVIGSGKVEVMIFDVVVSNCD